MNRKIDVYFLDKNLDLPTNAGDLVTLPFAEMSLETSQAIDKVIHLRFIRDSSGFKVISFSPEGCLNYSPLSEWDDTAKIQ